MKEIVRAIAVSTMLLALLSLTGCGFSVYAAHLRANSVLVEIEDYCSGIVIDRVHGYVSTAAHCTDDFSKWAITHKETYSGKSAVVIVKLALKQKLTRRVISVTGDVTEEHEYDAVLLGTDLGTDVAVLKVVTNLNDLPNQAEMSRSKLGYGDEVYTMGNPSGDVASVAKGVVVNPNVSFTDSERSRYSHMIRHDAYMFQGSSGGGLFDSRGLLVGVTNWTSHGATNMASPISNVIKLMAKLKL